MSQMATVQAIPAWARKYQTSCSTCHAPFPKLNYFGKAFRNNGYRFPGGDAVATKQPAVSLGAESYKRLFPKALWPSDIPGTVPIAVRGVARFNTYRDSRTTTFEFPHEFEVLSGGTLGETFSFFGELEVENENNENELGMGLMLQYDPRPGLHFRMGSLPVHPISDGLRLTASHYTSAYDARATPGSMTLKAPNPNGSTATLSVAATTGEDRWRFREDQAGVSMWGARNGPKNRGGVTWAVGFVNGQGVIDANDHKDVFAQVAYKFGGYGELGGGDLSQSLEYWRDDSFKVGAFTYAGKSTNNYTGSTMALSGAPGAGIVDVSAESTVDNTFHVAGVEFDWWIRDLNLFGLYLRQHDDNPRGTGETIDTRGWFVEGNYTIYPWLVGVLRYGATSQDFSVRSDPTTQRFLVPALVFVARANIKFTIETQARLDTPGKGHNVFLAAIDFAF